MAVTSLPMAGRGQDSPGRTTRRPRRGHVRGMPGRAGAPTAGPGRPPGRASGPARRGPRPGARAAGLGVAAGTLALVGDLKQLADLAQPQSGPLGALDQPQPADRGLVIEPVAGGRAGRFGQQADAFVVADGVGAEAGLVGEGGTVRAMPQGKPWVDSKVEGRILACRASRGRPAGWRPVTAFTGSARGRRVLGPRRGFPSPARMTGSMARAPTGSAHHQPNSSCSPTPASRASDTYEQTQVSVASATRRGCPSRGRCAASTRPGPA